jgi:caffeoyl-CoA O-methyltransferase
MAFQLDEAKEAYVLANSAGYGKTADALARETTALGEPAIMMLGREQFALLKFLVRGSRFALDLGTFTGLSALALAEGMREGKVVTVDRSDEWSSIAERHWRAAGVRDRIEARHDEASDVLGELAAMHARVDFAFIDVDKAGMHRYAEAVLGMLAPDGVVAVDNTLWHGWVLDPARTDSDTEGVRRFSEWIAKDAGIDAVMLPIADGMTLVRRRR